MKKILTASKDTTIYQAYPTNNAGFDEILEVGKMVDTTLGSVSVNTYASSSARSLLYFELPTVDSVSPNADYYLNLKLANAENLYRNQKILVYQISRAWDEGSGYFYQQPNNVNDGATWRQATPITSWSLAGGDAFTGAASQSVTLTSYPLQDLRINVTNVVRPLVNQSLQTAFYGFALQFPTGDELNTDNKGNIKFFSTQTHTIHQPTLEIGWDAQIFVTGSLIAVPTTLDVKIAPSNIQSTYQRGDVTRINLVVRDKYPLKSFDNTLRYRNKYYLPATSYYSVIDSQANVAVIPFDDYSKIDCDASGSYIVLDTSPLYRGRFYQLRLKLVSGLYTRTIDMEQQFLVL
jgi:hypothetical protein